MQMVSICVCQAYADVGHMDMLNLCCILSFPGQIRKKVVPDLIQPRRRAAARKHKMHYSVRRIIYYMLCYSLFS